MKKLLFAGLMGISLVLIGADSSDRCSKNTIYDKSDIYLMDYVNWLHRMNHYKDGIYSQYGFLSKLKLVLNRPLWVDCSKVNALSDQEYSALTDRTSVLLVFGSEQAQMQASLIRPELRILLNRIEQCARPDTKEI